MIEVILIGIFGGALIAAGYYGIVVYARTFLGDPRATITADILLVMLKGPGAVPVVMCAMLFFGGIWLITLSIVMFITATYHIFLAEI